VKNETKLGSPRGGRERWPLRGKGGAELNFMGKKKKRPERRENGKRTQGEQDLCSKEDGRTPGEKGIKGGNLLENLNERGRIKKGITPGREIERKKSIKGLVKKQTRSNLQVVRGGSTQGWNIMDTRGAVTRRGGKRGGKGRGRGEKKKKLGHGKRRREKKSLHHPRGPAKSLEERREGEMGEKGIERVRAGANFIGAQAGSKRVLNRKKNYQAIKKRERRKETPVKGHRIQKKITITRRLETGKRRGLVGVTWTKSFSGKLEKKRKKLNLRQLKRRQGAALSVDRGLKSTRKGLKGRQIMRGKKRRQEGGKHRRMGVNGEESGKAEKINNTTFLLEKRKDRRNHLEFRKRRKNGLPEGRVSEPRRGRES